MKKTGKYKGYTHSIMVLTIFVGLMVYLPLLGVKSTGAILAVFGLSFLVIFAGVMLACYTPCSWEADDEGFAITVLGCRSEYKYSELRNIEYEYVNTRYGGMIKLTVRDNMCETVFRENCNNADMTALLKDPMSGKRPQLIQLSDYVKEKTGEQA